MKFYNRPVLFLLFLSSVAVNTFSQSADKTLEFEKKGKISESPKVDFITDSNNSRVVIFTHFEKFSNVHLLDSSLNEIGKFVVPTKEKASFKGGFLKGDSLFFIYFIDTYKETVLTTCYYSLSKKSIAQKSTDITFYNENALDMFMSGSKIFLLASKNGEFILHLHSFNTNGEKTGTKAYSFNGIVSAVTKKIGSSFFSLENRPAFVRANFEPDFNTIKSQNKIYITTDSLYITANNNEAVTEVFSINLNNSGKKYRSFYHSSGLGISGQEKKVKDNSFLCNSILFYASVNSDSLRFLVTDFITGQELKSFSAGRKDSIYFKNTALRRYGANDKKIIDKLLFNGGNTSDLFHAMLNGNLVIFAEETHLGYEVTIGAYKRYWDSNPSPFSPATGSPSIGAGAPMMSSTQKEKEEIFEFVTLIDKLNNSHIPSTTNQIKSFRKKKEEVAKKKKVDVIDLQYIQVGNHQLFLYCNSFRRHLKLYKSETVN